MKREEAELILKKFQEGSKFIIKYFHDWTLDVILAGTADITYITKDKNDKIIFFVENDTNWADCCCDEVKNYINEKSESHLIHTYERGEWGFCIEEKTPGICYFTGGYDLEEKHASHVFELKKIEGIDYDDND
jgi:hypothetical protein